MSYCLPVLQYEQDDAAASENTLQASKEQHAESGIQHQPTLTSDNSSSSRPAAAKPAAAAAAKSAPVKGKGTSSIKQKKQSKEPQQQQEQPDVAAKPDAMQALARERKRRAFIGMLKLLEHGAKDSSELQMLVGPMSDEELLQVAQERALAGKCGNALCKQTFMGQTARGNYRMTGGHVQYIEPIEGDFYCSKSCRSFTQQLAVQLVKPLERLKPSVLQKALAKPSHKPQQQGVGAQGGGVTTMKSVIEERNPYQLIHEAESAGRRLDEAAAALQGDSTAAAAVEGYIPRQAPDTQPRHQQQQQQQEGVKGVLQLEPVSKQPVTGSTPADASASASAAAAADSLAAAGIAGVSTTSSSSRAAAAKQPAAVSSSTGASVRSSSSSSSSSQASGGEDLQQYLQVFRDHQQQKVQQLHQRDPAVLSSNGTSTNDSSSSSTHGQAGEAAALPVQQSEGQDSQQQQEQQGQQEKQGQRRVRFAPDIAFSCPADPAAHHLEQQQQQEQQPVLTFTLCGDSSGRAAAGSNGSALVGELQVATVSGAVDGGASAAEGGASSGADTDQDEEQQQQQQVPEAWKLFLPPALGGLGVPVKQVVIEQPPVAPAAIKQRQRSQQQPQQEQDSKKQQQQQQQQGGLPAEPSNGKLPAQTHSSSTTCSSEHSSSGGSGKSSIARSAAVEHTSGCAITDSRPAAGVSAAVSSSSAGAAAAGAGSSSAAAAGAGSSSDAAAGSSAAAAAPVAAGKARKFSPLVRPRRSVVVLDEVPGVTLQHRGVRPGGNRATPPAATAAVTSPNGSSSQGAPGTTASAAAAVGATTTTTISSSSSVERQTAAAHSNGVCSTIKKKGVVQIGPLRDHGNQEASYGYRNGIGGSEDSEGGGESESEGEMSDASSQEDWRPEGNSSSSRGAGQQQQQQRLQRKSNAAAADDEGNPWDSDSDAAAADSNGDGADGSWKDMEGEGSDAEAALDVGPDGLSVQSAKEALDSMMPFFDTKGITVTLSEFGLLWNTLHGWVSPSTLAYVADRRAVGADSSSSSRTADSSSNGAVAEPHDDTDPGAAAAEQQPTESLPVLQQRIALVNLLTAALPAVTQSLGLSVPEAQISKHLTALVRTFYLPGPLPALQSRQWQLLLTLMLGALAAWRLPGLRPVFRREQQAGSKLCVLLRGLSSDVDRFWALMDLFELHA